MANTGKSGGSSRERAEDLGRTAGQAGQKAQDTASSLGERAKETAESVAGGAQDAMRKAGEVASAVGQRAEEAMTSVGGQMKTLAGTIRERAPHEGMAGTAAGYVADTLEAGGRYMQEQNLSGMANELTTMIRRYPIQAVLVGIGVGFLMARATRS